MEAEIKYECPFTKDPEKKTVTTGNWEIEGGCIGHHGDDDYCYCESAHVEVTKCPACGGRHDFNSW